MQCIKCFQSFQINALAKTLPMAKLICQFRGQVSNHAFCIIIGEGKSYDCMDSRLKAFNLLTEMEHEEVCDKSKVTYMYCQPFVISLQIEEYYFLLESGTHNENKTTPKYFSDLPISLSSTSSKIRLLRVLYAPCKQRKPCFCGFWAVWFNFTRFLNFHRFPLPCPRLFGKTRLLRFLYVQYEHSKPSFWGFCFKGFETIPLADFKMIPRTSADAGLFRRTGVL